MPDEGACKDSRQNDVIQFYLSRATLISQKIHIADQNSVCQQKQCQDIMMVCLFCTSSLKTNYIYLFLLCRVARSQCLSPLVKSYGTPAIH